MSEDLKEAPLPTAACRKCGKAYFGIYSLGVHKCYRPIGYNKNCNGYVGSAICVGDWERCWNCLDKKDYKCFCEGARWIFVRDKPWMKKTKGIIEKYV
jgi:hypothetical protein